MAGKPDCVQSSGKSFSNTPVILEPSAPGGEKVGALKNLPRINKICPCLPLRVRRLPVSWPLCLSFPCRCCYGKPGNFRPRLPRKYIFLSAGLKMCYIFARCQAVAVVSDQTFGGQALAQIATSRDPGTPRSNIAKTWNAKPIRKIEQSSLSVRTASL